MKKLLFIAVLFLGITLTSFAQQKAKKQVAISAKKVEKSRGENPNIKKDFVCNAPDVAAPKPEKSRGEICQINFENWTGYSVKVYVDGVFEGWLNPWENGNVSVYAGYTTVYCITAGGTYEWAGVGECSSAYDFKISVD